MTLQLPTVHLKKGRAFPIQRGHPWLFSGGIHDVTGDVTAGCVVDLVDDAGLFVARGYYNPKTDIAVRVLTQDATEDIDQAFFVQRLSQALALREQTLDFTQTDGYRVVHGEGDFLPGVVLDWYAGVAVIQSHTAGIDHLLEPLLAAVIEVLQPTGIIVRNDVQVRSREGLPRDKPRLVYGAVPEVLQVRENGFSFGVDPWLGQKTGFYTDQRDKRRALQTYCARLDEGATLLNCFCYTAGFSVYGTAVNPGLRTLNIDQSTGAIEQAKVNFLANGLPLDDHRFEVTDAFSWLENPPDEQFDIVILDPPAFAKTNRERDKALQGYFRLNVHGLERVKLGGMLITCSCSGSVSRDDMEECLRQASIESGRRIQITEILEHGTDHPVNLMAPESRYLKVFFCRVL